MQVAVALPSVGPVFVGEQGHCLPQDSLLREDSLASATIMAKLFVDAYVPTIFAAEAVEKTPASGYRQGLGQAEEAAASLPLALQQRSVVEPIAPILAPATLEQSAVVDVEGAKVINEQDLCFLENCDRILPHLYLGGIEAAVDSRSLAQQGVRAVVCCNRELEFPTSKFLPELEYYRVDIEDMGREPIELFLPEATEFIHTQLLQERPVLVHCKAGVSRSASVLLAYLMEYCGYSLHDAFLLTLRHRPTITPNPGFMARLRDYEKDILGMTVASIDINKYVEWFQAAQRCPEPILKP